jgi:exosortase
MATKDKDLSTYLLAPSRLVCWTIIFVLLLLLYGEVLQKWASDIWNDPNYSHGLLIPLVSLYLLKQRWPVIRDATRTPCNTGFFIILASLAIYALGVAGGEQFSQRVSFVVLFYGLVLFIEGKEISRLLLFPIALFLFAIPLPYILYNSIAFPLKLIATKIAAQLIRFTGMPVFRDGNIIHLPHTTLEVVDACSGIRSLMTLLTLAFLLASFQIKSIWKRIFLVLLALPIAVVANAARVSVTAILTKSDPAWGSGGVFVISFGVLIGISFVLERRSKA